MKINKNLYQYTDYKIYVLDRLRQESPRGHGQRVRLAASLGCHTTYITQVLSGNSHLSLEQGERANQFFHHSEAESEYFLSLVIWGRAGTPDLKKRIEKRLEAQRNEAQELRQFFHEDRQLSEAEQQRYYLSWRTAALHMLLGVEGPGTFQFFLGKTKWSESELEKNLAILESLGIAVKEGARYRLLKANLFLERGSPFLVNHHTNWRLRALDSLSEESPDELHYTSVSSLARSDVLKLRQILQKAIEEMSGVIRPSKEEELVTCTLDLFRPFAE